MEEISSWMTPAAKGKKLEKANQNQKLKNGIFERRKIKQKL
jgi:hypothetical protein